MNTRPLPPLTILALGPLKMLRIAIARHRRIHQGRRPDRIELHPVVLAEIKRLLPPWAALRADDGLSLFYDNVPLMADPRNRAPLLIDWRGQPEEL